MKNFVSFIILIILVSCSDKPVQKPDNLLNKEEMENIIYDISILQAAEVFKPEILVKNNIKIKNYIYKKYTIDSTIFFQNYRYYAADIKAFKKIYKNVNNRIESQKSEIDTLLKTKNIQVPDDLPTYIPQTN